MTELICLERKHYGFLATMYESGFGGFAYRKMIGYSKSGAVKELRRCGVVCPKRAYTEQ